MKDHVAKDIERVARAMAKKSPLTWSAITAKRYLLPAYRQADYTSQAYLDATMLFFLVGYFGTAYGFIPDPVMRATYMLQVLALNEGRPVWYLERELGEVLMKTKLPHTLGTDQLHWRRQGLRIMLPKGMLGFQRGDGPVQSLMFLDVARLEAGQQLTLAPEQEKELTLLGQAYQERVGKPVNEVLVRPNLEQSGFIVGGQLDAYVGPRGDMPIGEHYAVIRPNGKLGEVFKIGHSFDQETNAPTDDSDQTLMERMQHLAINVLLFMGSVPLEYEAEERPASGNHQGPLPEHHGLWPAKFVGKSQYRPSKKTEHYHTATWSGRRLPRHWRCGHWKQQPYGKAHEDRKLIWIEPYETYGPPPEEEDDESKAA